MKGIEKISAHIEADAKAAAQSVLDAAQAKVNQIKADFDQKVKTVYETKIADGKKEIDGKVDNAARLGNMEAKKSVLAAKQEMVSKAFDRAQEMIIDLPAAKYEAFLTKLVVESANTGKEQVVFNERDKSKHAKKVVDAANKQLSANGMEGGLTVADRTADIAGGVLLSEGGIEVNSTLELLMDVCRTEMSSQVAEVLFGE